MKIAVITDQHFGARKNSKVFHDFFLEFYDNVFFPTIKEQGITTVIDMGDTFDSRKGIDFASLAWAKDHYYDKLESLGCELHTVVGNHTAYYKNTNDINAVDLLLREYKNVKVYSNPTEVNIGGLDILFIPWINQENEELTFKTIKKTTCKCAMGHLELAGFAANRQCIMEHGYDRKLFKKIPHVYSGHYHTRSSSENITYIGNPYEIYWTDYDDPRGFIIFDTETLTHEHVDNPYKMFHTIYYEDTDSQIFNFSKYANKIVKLIVRKKTDIRKFDKFVDNLYSANVFDLKIIENYQEQDLLNTKEYEHIETEDTVSILNTYINQSEVSLNKNTLSKIIQEIYKESCEMI
jgi:hypothetical protein